MVVGGTDRTPYEAVVRLWAWATAVWSYIDGKLLLAGIDAHELAPDRLLNVVFTMMADSFGQVNRTVVIDELETYLSGADVPDRERWGTDPAYVAQQRGNISAYGPPPGWTPKPKE